MNKTAQAGHKSTERSCFLCREQRPKNEMLRLVVDEAGQIWPDVLQKAPGRGTYLCMRKECLSQLSDKRLGMLKQHFAVRLPQSDDLMSRTAAALELLIKQQFNRLRQDAAVGRDAVMHRMWKNRPLLIVLAIDAGDALIRQVHDAVEKRDASGLKTGLIEGFSSDFLALCFGRDRVSTVALADEPKTKRLQLISAWYRQLKVSG